jgi:hypothetical protein
MRRALLTCLVLATSANARAQTCPPDEEVAPWVSLDASEQGPGSTTAPDTAALSICSTTDGFGDATDHYRYAFQLRDYDFTLQALVSSVDPGGSAALVAVVPTVSSAHAARVIAEVYVTPAGSAVLRSWIRRQSDGMSDPPIAELPISLPATLRLVRAGNEIRTEVVGGSTHLTATLDAAGELMGPLRVGVGQASNEASLRSASFARISLTGQDPGASVECVEAEAAMSGAPFRISGRHLDAVDGVRIAGMDAPISTMSSSRLVVDAPSMSGGFIHGPVEISQNGRFRRVGEASFVGTAIRRGDVDEDGDVGTEDYRRLCYAVYRGASLQCSAAGDIDADGDTDADDVDRLRRYLEGGATADAPAPPFDTPGFVEGSLACGLPQAPEIHAIELADGSPIERPIREGDDLAIVGVGLPAPERAVVRFGNTEATPSMSSTDTRLFVRVGPVFTDGDLCPRIFDADPAAPGETRFGPAFGLDDTSELCVPFEASALDGHLRSRMVGDQLEIDVPPTSLRPGTRLHVSLSLHLPYVVGQTRGPRSASFDYVVPNATYEDALSQLGLRIAEAIHGTETDECGCEVAPTDVVLEEKLILPPCSLLPELPPQPTVPGLPTQVEPTKLIWTQMDIFTDVPGPGCDDTISRATEPRRFFWCQLEELAQIQGADAPALLQGLPLWEGFDPPVLHVSPDPRERGTDEKRILVDDTMTTFIELYYDDPCEWALRGTQCSDSFFSTWIPKFGEGGRVIKTIWQPLDNLPASVDETTLYSYDPEGAEPRMYLVGMHIGYSIGMIGSGGPPDYLVWSTFWLPAEGDTTTKGGESLSAYYSSHCTVGAGGDRPASLDGTPFEAFAMCTDSRTGEEACGNPWIPSECPQGGAASCTNCHETMGTQYWGGNESSFDPPDLRVGWLPSLINAYGADATACLADVESSPGSFSSDWIRGAMELDAKACSWGI